MKPIKLFAENFKGIDIDQPLKLVNMFTGPNESGKSAHIEAALIALLGYNPNIGKQPSATFGYASEMRATPMTTHIEFDVGFKTRTFKRNAKSEVSRDVKGDLPEVPEVLFNASDYLKATSQERIKAVFEKIDVSKIVINDEDLISKLSKIEITPAVVCAQSMVELLDYVKKSITRRQSLKQTAQVWLEELVKGLQETGKGHKGLMDGASGEMTALRPNGKAPESSAGAIKIAKNKVTEIEKVLAGLQADLATYNRTIKRREEITALLAKPSADVGALEKEKAELDAKVADYKSSTAEFQRNIEALQKEITTRSSEARAFTEAMATIQVRIKDLEGKVKCPYCKSNRQGWKEEHKSELLADVEVHKAKIAEQDARLDWLQDQLASAKSDLALSQKKDREMMDLKNQSVQKNNDLMLERVGAKNRAELEGELKGLAAIEQPSETAIKNATNDLTVSREALFKLEAQELLFTQSQANAGKLREVEAKLISHQVSHELFKRAAQLVIAEQQAIVTAAFDSILAPARRFTDGIVGGQLNYQNGELGINSDLGWVGHKFLAESRREIVYLGLQVALAQQSPIKVVLFDEMGRFDSTTKPMIIKRFLDLTREGFIDCAMCGDPSSTDYESIQDPDFQLVRLAAKPVNKV